MLNALFINGHWQKPVEPGTIDVFNPCTEETRLPPGIVNIITGQGATGAAMTAHRDVAKISFTGSNSVGTRVVQAAAHGFKSLGLELGGKSPIIVVADADEKQAIDLIIGGIFHNAGQMCSATSRLLVDKRIVSRTLERVVEVARALKLDNALDPSTTMGPITTRAQYEKVQGYVAKGKALGHRLVTGGGELEARFLSMWCPPVYVGGCSQALIAGANPMLIRSYDYSPPLLESTWLASRFNGKRVIAMIDCLWGVLDGINEDGLAVSLSFGGRTVSGQGFGIPIVLRYVLEFAATVPEAIELLRRVPVHMAYSVALMDRSGRHGTVYVSPDKGMEVVDKLIFQTSYDLGYGTLYAAAYYPATASVELIWPGLRWHQSCADFSEGSRNISFNDEPGNSSHAIKGQGQGGFT